MTGVAGAKEREPIAQSERVVTIGVFVFCPKISYATVSRRDSQSLKREPMMRHCGVSSAFIFARKEGAA